MDMLGKEAGFAGNAAVTRLKAEYTQAFAVLETPGSHSEADVQAVLAAAARLDSALAAKKSNVFGKVAIAHQSLTDALASPSPSFANVIATLEQLTAEARHLQQLADAVETQT
jgi:hypothetical protein